MPLFQTNRALLVARPGGLQLAELGHDTALLTTHLRAHSHKLWSGLEREVYGQLRKPIPKPCHK